MAASQKASAVAPAPCEPLGAEEEKPRTFAEDKESGVKIADTTNGLTPSVVGAERREAENAAVDAANEARATAGVDAPAGQTTATAQPAVEAPTFANGIARVILPERDPVPAPQPLIVLPKALEKTAAQTKGARR